MPDNAKPAQDLGEFLAEMGHTEGALHWLQECMVRDRRNAHCPLKLGLLHIQAGRHTPAITLLERAAKLQPSRQAFNGLGVAYFHTKRPDLALLAYASAVAADDGIIANTVAVLVNAAGAMLSHNAALAVRAYATAVRCKHSHAQARFGLGRALMWLTPPRVKAATHHLGQSIRLDPSFTQVCCTVLLCQRAICRTLTPTPTPTPTPLPRPTRITRALSKRGGARAALQLQCVCFSSSFDGRAPQGQVPPSRGTISAIHSATRCSSMMPYKVPCLLPMPSLYRFMN